MSEWKDLPDEPGLWGKLDVFPGKLIGIDKYRIEFYRGRPRWVYWTEQGKRDGGLVRFRKTTRWIKLPETLAELEAMIPATKNSPHPKAGA